MITSRLRDHLDRRAITYESLSHDRTTTATEVAASAGVPEEQVVKAVLVHADGRPHLVVVPAAARVDIDAVRRFTGSQRVALADELECAATFPDCEAGAQPALGHLYQVPVLADHTLGVQRSIVFNAGTHTQALRMGWLDFRRLTQARLGAFAEPVLASL